jgi:hypothetical protein
MVRPVLRCLLICFRVRERVRDLHVVPELFAHLMDIGLAANAFPTISSPAAIPLHLFQGV